MNGLELFIVAVGASCVAIGAMVVGLRLGGRNRDHRGGCGCGNTGEADCDGSGSCTSVKPSAGKTR